MFRLPFVFLRVLGRVALAAYFVAAVLFLGLRYWVLPNVDQWQPYISQQLSSALGTQVRLGGVTAEWTGLYPRLRLSDVSFMDGRQRIVLSVPHVQAVVSWRSLLAWTPQFVSLEASGLDLSVRRDRHQKLWVLGKSFETEHPEDDGAAVHDQALNWVASQPQITLRDTTLRWTDETRDASPLVLDAVTMTIQNRGLDHRFMLTAMPPTRLGKSLDLRGEFQRKAGLADHPFALEHGQGRLYVHIEKMQPLGWRPWFDVSTHVESGEVSAKAWLALAGGVPGEFTSDVSIKEGRLAFGGSTHVEAGFLRLHMSGPWAGFDQAFPSDGEGGRQMATRAEAGTDAPAVEYRLEARELDVSAPGVFEHLMHFSHIGAQGTVQSGLDYGLRVQARHVRVQNADMDASLEGSWENSGSSAAGTADVRGRFAHASIAAIDAYLPSLIDAEAREWMAEALVGGQITDAVWLLNGDLAHFPFAMDPGKGDFKISGNVTGGVIDYLPAEGNSLGWPRISDMQGVVSLHRADLQINSHRAAMHPTAKLAIDLADVTARIPDLENESILSITGNTTANAQAYLSLMTHSRLGGMLGGVFDHTVGDGVWQVPLALTIPLNNANDTEVDGAIRFSGGTLRLFPGMPPFTNVAGTLNFTTSGLDTTSLNADFLGGPVAFSGGVGGESNGLKMQGMASAAALQDYIDLQGMQRLRGNAPYVAVLHRSSANAYSVVADSALEGMALDLPAPVGKTAKTKVPLHVEWRRSADKKNTSLDITLGKQIKAELRRRNAQKSGAFFHAAAIGVNQDAQIVPGGMNLDIRYPAIDMDYWDEIIAEFSQSSGKTAASLPDTLLPPIRQVRVQATEAKVLGLTLNELTFTARQPETERWRVDISSSETAGTLFWREAKGRVAGRVDAHFDRLSLGRDKTQGAADEPATREGESNFKIDDDLDIPGINLLVKNFRLYGREAGTLSLVGVNQARGRIWRLDELALTSPSAQLTGSGVWRLSGSDRGLSLDATAQIQDLGAYLDQLGMKDLMKEGSGTVRGKVEWRNMPWEFSKADLIGNIEFQLEKGRLNTVGSYSARLLELLSLQSLKRLARFDFNPASISKEGFPYDNLRGTLVLQRGFMRTSDYRVIGPIGTIVLGGDVNLLNEKLDLQAVVIPNLDVSGAAIAAGIAINPIVGIGAFLTQWLLQAPLAKAMTAEYQISGTWGEPRIADKAAPAQASESGLGMQKTVP
ncbi:MAG TPA: YhdP family protein [Candidimonas sp.]|nr:YhdP family protein [Candidimonas sp.]